MPIPDKIRVLGPNGAVMGGRFLRAEEKKLGQASGGVPLSATMFRIGFPGEAQSQLFCSTGGAIEKKGANVSTFSIHPEDLAAILAEHPAIPVLVLKEDVKRYATFGTETAPGGRTRYRYLLGQSWQGGEDSDPLLWIMLNPSDGDEMMDDRTLVRVRGFSHREKFRRFEVVNLFAYVSPYPGDLRTADDPIGPQNEEHILAAVERAKGKVIVGWGSRVSFAAKSPTMAFRGRDRYLLDLLKARGVTPLCLGAGKDGAPNHPLMLEKDTPLVPFVRRHP